MSPTRTPTRTPTRRRRGGGHGGRPGADRRAAVATAPLRRPEPGPGRHTVRPAREARPERTRLVGLVGVVSVVVILVGLFGMAGFHAVIVEGQRELDRLETRASELRAENSRLEVRLAELLAPSRIEQEAKTRLGMVEPTDVTYLAPVPPRAVPQGAG